MDGLFCIQEELIQLWRESISREDSGYQRIFAEGLTFAQMDQLMLLNKRLDITGCIHVSLGN